MPPIVEVQSLNHWTARKVPEIVIYFFWFSCTEARDGEGRRRGSTSPEWKTTHLAVPIYPQYPGSESVDACDYFELLGHSNLFWGFPLMDRREFCLHYYLCVFHGSTCFSLVLCSVLFLVEYCFLNFLIYVQKSIELAVLSC